MKYRVRYAGLPLAVYREVAAHLGQVNGVEISVIPQQSREFDYGLSQVDSLSIQHPDTLDRVSQQQLDRILAYYSDRYGTFEILASED